MQNHNTVKDLKKKYLKYKTKYVNLKHAMSGGWKSEAERLEVEQRLRDLKREFMDIRDKLDFFNNLPTETIIAMGEISLGFSPEKRTDELLKYISERREYIDKFIIIHNLKKKLEKQMEENGISGEELLNLKWTNKKERSEVLSELREAEVGTEQVKIAELKSIIANNGLTAGEVFAISDADYKSKSMSDFLASYKEDELLV